MCDDNASAENMWQVISPVFFPRAPITNIEMETNLTMKMLPLIAATLSLSALATSSALAQDKPMAAQDMSTGKTVMMVPAKMNGDDTYKTGWVFNNLDAREVKRYKAQGFKDDTIKGAANIALRTGLEIGYVLSQYRTSGYPLLHIANSYGVTQQSLNADITGMGASYMSVMPGSSMPISTTMASPAPAMAGDITSVAMADPQFSTLVAAVKAADLVSALQGPGPLTVFAPTNAAFEKLPAGTLDDLLKPENKEKLRTILLYHVISGKIMASDVMAMKGPGDPKTLQGGTVHVTNVAPVMVNNATVTATDIKASNGVIHVIDTVLMPPM